MAFKAHLGRKWRCEVRCEGQGFEGVSLSEKQ